jgi:hypothetical protein
VCSGCVAHGDAAATGGVEIDVVGAGAPDRHHLQLRAGREDAVGEPGVCPDVDGHARAVDALDQLLLLVGATRGEHARLAELLGAVVGGRVLEHARKIVGDDYCSDGWLHG